MSRRRAYRATAVKNVSLEKALESGPEGAVTVGMDVGKDEVFVVLRWSDATFERPWKVRNPVEITQLVRILTELGQRRCLTVGMESTGTYGDALRQALTDAKLNVHRDSVIAAVAKRRTITPRYSTACHRNTTARTRRSSPSWWRLANRVPG